MQNPAADDREYWTRVLAAGGTTAVPRWVTDPAPGVGEHVAPIPTELQAAVDGTRSAPLTAHAAVLAALSGEADVVTGYVPAGAERPLPCPLSAGPATWRELLDRTRDAERELLAHADFPVEAARSEAVFGGADLPADAVLGVSATDRRPPGVRCYRRDALDAEAAARIAGYHLTALHRSPPSPTPRPTSTACSPPRRSRSRSTAWRARTASCPTTVSTSCSSSGCAPTRTRSPPSARAGAGPTGS